MFWGAGEEELSQAPERSQAARPVDCNVNSFSQRNADRLYTSSPNFATLIKLPISTEVLRTDVAARASKSRAHMLLNSPSPRVAVSTPKTLK